MRPLLLVSLCLCAVAPGLSAQAELEPRSVTVEPGVTRPGQSVLLRWYFTGTKVILSGGRFGKGLNVTGKSTMSDRPAKTTRYAFDVWYKPLPDPARPDVKPAQIHQQYTATVAVDRLSSFHGTEGFDVRYLEGWRTDTFSPEAGSKVYYFQPEQDSVERLAVAVVPAKDGETPADIMERVRADVPSHYTNVEFVSRYDLSRQKEAAQITTFRGIDQTHPNTRTESIILVHMHHGRAFVVSARTEAGKFAERQALLDGLVRSISFNTPTASR